MAQSTTTLLDLNAMLEGTLDAIPTAPDFVESLPNGTYQLAITDCKIESYETKDKTKAQRIRMSYVVRATVELADQNAVPVPNESMFSQTYQGTTQGLSFWKKDVCKILNVGSVDGTPFNTVMQSVTGAEFKALVTCKEKDGFVNISIKPIH